MKRKQLKIIVAMFLLVGLSLFYSGRKVEVCFNGYYSEELNGL